MPLVCTKREGSSDLGDEYVAADLCRRDRPVRVQEAADPADETRNVERRVTGVGFLLKETVHLLTMDS